MEQHKATHHGVEIFSHIEEDCEELRDLAFRLLKAKVIRYGGSRPQYGEQRTGDPASFFYYDKTHYRHTYWIEEA